MLDQLLETVEKLSAAKDLETVMSILKIAARELTHADGASFVLREGDNCYYAEENAISPLWKGRRFPMESCVSGWVMHNKQSVVIPDIYQDARVPVEAYRPTFVKSMLMVPVRKEDPIAAIGNYWAEPHTPTEKEISLLETLANFTSIALENIRLNNELNVKMAHLNESNEKLESFAWITVHDFKAPLRAIHNLGKWIGEELGDNKSPKVASYLDLIEQRVARLAKFQSDLLAYVQVEQKITLEKMEPANEILEEALLLLTIPAHFSVTWQDQLKDVLLPIVPFRNVFLNLIQNAIYHHDKKEGRVRIDLMENEAEYIFLVKDDGPGIPAEYCELIFQLFQTLKPRDSKEGSGMGLAISRRMLNACEATIELLPAEGRGATFKITYPKPLTYTKP